MTGYKFTTEQEAQLAITQCDTYYGYPKPDCVTQHWCGYQYSEVDNFYYIIYDQSIEIVLGTPEDFDITLSQNIM